MLAMFQRAKMRQPEQYGCKRGAQSWGNQSLFYYISVLGVFFTFFESRLPFEVHYREFCFPPIVHMDVLDNFRAKGVGASRRKIYYLDPM